MGRENHVVEACEVQVRRRGSVGVARVAPPHVDDGPGDRPVDERGVQRLLVHHCSARHIDQDRGRTHRGQRSGVDQPPGGVGEGDGHDHEVGGGEQLVEPVVASDPVERDVRGHW
jgi:hypothetical protein